MNTALKLVLVGVVAFMFSACAVCTPGQYSTDKIISVDLQLEPVPDVPEVTMIKEKVLFDFDSYKLDAEAMSIVDKVANLMKEYPDTLLAIKGHTDHYGSNEYNQTLSENRAEAVTNALLDKGVPEDSIETVEGFGKTQLIPNLTNRENRRVLILSIGE